MNAHLMQSQAERNTFQKKLAEAEARHATKSAGQESQLLALRHEVEDLHKELVQVETMHVELQKPKHSDGMQAMSGPDILAAARKRSNELLAAAGVKRREDRSIERTSSQDLRRSASGSTSLPESYATARDERSVVYSREGGSVVRGVSPEQRAREGNGMAADALLAEVRHLSEEVALVGVTSEVGASSRSAASASVVPLHSWTKVSPVSRLESAVATQAALQAEVALDEACAASQEGSEAATECSGTAMRRRSPPKTGVGQKDKFTPQRRLQPAIQAKVGSPPSASNTARVPSRRSTDQPGPGLAPGSAYGNRAPASNVVRGRTGPTPAPAQPQGTTSVVLLERWK
jgi:hypothetical protein